MLLKRLAESMKKFGERQRWRAAMAVWVKGVAARGVCGCRRVGNGSVEGGGKGGSGDRQRGMEYGLAGGRGRACGMGADRRRNQEFLSVKKKGKKFPFFPFFSLSFFSLFFFSLLFFFSSFFFLSFFSFFFSSFWCFSFHTERGGVGCWGNGAAWWCGGGGEGAERGGREGVIRVAGAERWRAGGVMRRRGGRWGADGRWGGEVGDGRAADGKESREDGGGGRRRRAEVDAAGGGAWWEMGERTPEGDGARERKRSERKRGCGGRRTAMEVEEGATGRRELRPGG